jgi:hypothetical protein
VQSGVADQEIRRNLQPPGWRQKPGADVAEGITILPFLDWRIALDMIRRDEIRQPRRMNIEHQKHSRRLLTFECDLVACIDLH